MSFSDLIRHWITVQDNLPHTHIHPPPTMQICYFSFSRPLLVNIVSYSKLFLLESPGWTSWDGDSDRKAQFTILWASDKIHPIVHSMQKIDCAHRLNSITKLFFMHFISSPIFIHFENNQKPATPSDERKLTFLHSKRIAIIHYLQKCQVEGWFSDEGGKQRGKLNRERSRREKRCGTGTALESSNNNNNH